MKEVLEHFNRPRRSRQVAYWLLIGVAMIVVQVLIGGITRLTESGLSITEWKPLTGALPPLNDVAWQAEFDKYKGTDQFKYIHQNFSLSDFKAIFFWEWFHRLWARLLGIVFLAGFIYFILKRKFNKSMVIPMIILFLLGAVQGAIGWLMVKSGLVPEKYFVGHIELTTHLIAALGLLCYTLWFALGLLITPQQKIYNKSLHNGLLLILGVLILQLIYGGFMAGLKTAVVAPTWPDINGQFLPPQATDQSPLIRNFIFNPLAIHFVHRGLAYILLIIIAIWVWKARIARHSRLFNQLKAGVICTVALQVLLGILTVLNATYNDRLVWFGVLHQFVGMLLLVLVVSLLFITRRKGQPGHVL